MDTAAIQAAAAVQQSMNTNMTYRSMHAKGTAAEDADFLSTISQLSGKTDSDSNDTEISNDLLSVLAAMMQGNLQTPYADLMTAQTGELSALLDSDAISGTALVAMIQAQQNGDTDASALIQDLLGGTDTTLYDSIAEQYISTADQPLQQELSDALAWTAVPATEFAAGELNEAGVQIPVASVEHSQSDEAADLFAQSFAEGQFVRTIRASKDDFAQDIAVQEELAAVMQQTANTAPMTAAQTETIRPQEVKSVYDQTLQALTEKLTEAEETFKVRLTPEGLGDITVEMTRTTDGLLSINLAASSSRTAQMLSEQAGALQAALGQNAELSAITVEDPETDMFYQQYSEQQHQQNFNSGTNSNEHYQHRGNWEYSAEETAEANGAGVPAPGILNTYI
ncbi:MAG: flagellar hook-length control protein FliK [Ruminococcus sp.]|nr:flagellar hook-length control protein FliK [Ruminococcus sp.]